MNNTKFNRIYPWIVVALLWVVALLNYMDRQMLSTMREYMALDISELQSAEAFGVLMGIFLWIYAIVSPFAGTVADRLSRKWLIIGSLAVWSVVTLLMGYCTTFAQLKWLRGLMGISEALYIPSSLSLIADYHSGKSRSLAVGIHMTGLYLGQALGGFGANLASALTWQQTFHWFGIIGVVYAVILAFCLKDFKRAAPVGPDSSVMPGSDSPVMPGPDRASKDSIWKSFGLIFSNIAFWAILFFFASSSMPGWATKNWLPTLFQGSLNIPMEQAGPIATITIAAASLIGVLIGGPLSDRWVKKNLKGRVYTSAIGLSMMIPALVLIGLGSGLVAAVAAGLLFGIGYGMFDTNNMPILCQFVPSRLRATAYGFMNTIGVAMGAVCTQVLGRMQDGGHLGAAFAVLGVVTALALLVQLTVLKPTTDDMQ